MKEQISKIKQEALSQLKEVKTLQELNDLKGDIMNIDFGSQIRNYTLEPYKLMDSDRDIIADAFEKSKRKFHFFSLFLHVFPCFL